MISSCCKRLCLITSSLLNRNSRLRQLCSLCRLLIVVKFESGLGSSSAGGSICLLCCRWLTWSDAWSHLLRDCERGSRGSRLPISFPELVTCGKGFLVLEGSRVVPPCNRC